MVKPLLVRIRSVVEHDDNILSQFGGNRITRMRIRDSLGAEGSLFGFGADVALDIVIRQIVIPNCQRTMLDEIIRQIMLMCGKEAQKQNRYRQSPRAIP